MTSKRRCLLLAALLSISEPAAAFHTAPSHHRTIAVRSSITSCAFSTQDEAESSIQHNQAADTQRRKTVQYGLIGSLLSLFMTQPSDTANAAALPTSNTIDNTKSTLTSQQSSSSSSSSQLIADFPMRKLHLPKGGLGRSYIILQLYIDNKGPYDFMVDSGLTTELITPHLQSILGVSSSGLTKKGLSAGDVGTMQSLVDLTNVELYCGTCPEGKEKRLPLEGPLTAIVTDFPQEHLDPEHDPVEGMLGMEVLERFDIDLDFPAGRLRLWKPGSVGSSVAKEAGMTKIEAVVVNETRLLGFRVVSANAPRGGSSSGEDVVLTQPFLGLVDCGASFSVVNWKAASLLGLPPQSDKVYKKMPMVQGIGVDGRPQLLPTTNVGLSFCGNAIRNADDKSTISFEAPPGSWKPWDAVSMAIGDLPVFSQLLGDGVTAYKGPAGIIGLDILSQRRVILETGTGRRRRIYVGNS